MINEMATSGNQSLPSPASSRRVKIAIGVMALAVPFALAELNLGGFGGLPGHLGVNGMAATAAAPTLASRLGDMGANMLAVLGLRSPGERSQGELADSKRQASNQRAYPSSLHHQRALAKVRPPRAVPPQLFSLSPPNDATTSAVSNAFSPAPQVGTPVEIAQLAPAVGGGPGGGFLPGGGIGFPPGGGGGGVGGGPMPGGSGSPPPGGGGSPPPGGGGGSPPPTGGGGHPPPGGGGSPPPTGGGSPPPTGGGGSPPPGGGGGGPLPGGGGGGPPPGGGGGHPPPVIPPVPEPSTWGLMLVGFWGIGAALRRRPRQDRLTGAANATAEAR